MFIDKKWLLVFDNANSWEDLRGYWPCCASGSILITSQVSELGQSTTSNILLRPFKDKEGASLLVKEVGADTISQQDLMLASSISQVLGGLPLAIAHVAGYIRQTRIGFKDFLALFQTRQNSSKIFSEAINTPHYDKNLRLIYEIALQELSDSSRKLAQILSMLSPEGVPVEMLTGDQEDQCLLFPTKSPSPR